MPCSLQEYVYEDVDGQAEVMPVSAALSLWVCAGSFL